MTALDLLRAHPPALVVRSWSTHGGTERYCHGFARWLVDRGVVPEVWCQDVQLPPDGVQLRSLVPRGRGRVGRIGATALAVSRIPSDRLRVGFLRAPGFDVLRAGGGAHAAWMEHHASRNPADFVERAADRWALRTAGTVVANSGMARRDILADTSRSVEDVVCVRNGVDGERFTPVAEQQREDAVVFVGHGFARKGLATAIEALQWLGETELWVVGHDRRAAKYLRLAEKLGVRARVRMFGAVSDPSTVLRRARAFVLPTRYDPSANVVLEAMACAVPPVTTRLDGASEVVPMPWLVVDDPYAARDVAEALRRAMSDPTIAERCRSAALEWSSERSFAGFADVLVSAAHRRAEVG